jgi:hypothetical protein
MPSFAGMTANATTAALIERPWTMQPASVA